MPEYNNDIQDFIDLSESSQTVKKCCSHAKVYPNPVCELVMVEFDSFKENKAVYVNEHHYTG